MNVDFLESFEAFTALTAHHRQKLWYPDKKGCPKILRAGKFGYHVKEMDNDYDAVCKWCHSDAYKVESSMPEELVFC